MKILKQLFLVALVVCAVNARASWTVIFPDAATVYPGSTGSSTFKYTPDINGTISPGYNLMVMETAPVFGGYVFFSAGGLGNPISAFSIASEPGSFTSGNQFSVTVDWTISSTVVVSPSSFFINFGLPTSNGMQTSSQNFTLDPTSVPEPMQAVASCMILGCGVLGFAGRRLLKKQAK